MSASYQEPSRITETLDLSDELVEALAERDAGLPAMIRLFLIATALDWYHLLDRSTSDQRGTVDEGTIDIPDTDVDMKSDLSGRVEVYWEEFYSTGCRDADVSGEEHYSPLDFILLPDEGKIRLFGAVNEERSTREEF